MFSLTLNHDSGLKFAIHLAYDLCLQRLGVLILVLLFDILAVYTKKIYLCDNKKEYHENNIFKN